jgi:hypothetical protein
MCGGAHQMKYYMAWKLMEAMFTLSGLNFLGWEGDKPLWWVGFTLAGKASSRNSEHLTNQPNRTTDKPKAWWAARFGERRELG